MEIRSDLEIFGLEIYKVKMKKLTILTVLLFISLSIVGQTTVEGSFMVNNIQKSYAIYVPENYDPSVPNAMMLGFHPLNINRWDAVSWRDTLIQFSETNDLLLVCPDGGPDGRVDDDIDTLFTSMLVDSVAQWYTVDQEEKYIMGFSVGGLATYTYGLRRTDEYKGLLAIGAAVNISDLQDVLPLAANQTTYVLHGSLDAINTRYTPIVNALEQVGACVTTNLLSGVGHTIDFPDRNNILTDAYNVLKNSTCGLSSSQDVEITDIVISPNPSSGSFTLKNINDRDINSIVIYDPVGAAIDFSINGQDVIIQDDWKGILYMSYKKNGTQKVEKLLIQ